MTRPVLRVVLGLALAGVAVLFGAGWQKDRAEVVALSEELAEHEATIKTAGREILNLQSDFDREAERIATLPEKDKNREIVRQGAQLGKEQRIIEQRRTRARKLAKSTEKKIEAVNARARTRTLRFGIAFGMLLLGVVVLALRRPPAG